MAPKRDIESSNVSGSDQSEAEEDGSSSLCSEIDETGTTISETDDLEYESQEILRESEEDVCTAEQTAVVRKRSLKVKVSITILMKNRYSKVVGSLKRRSRLLQNPVKEESIIIRVIVVLTAKRFSLD